ncbi:hypothetical protein L195_g046928 [Trifolium pratense]|uniref:Uncharacterized protein n=1 Tax=Trifolium pratense TaxID=57577 RepID=A0A2K3MJ53_TRIPR|nr:hypothetical protein L195_g046928 [Trifolium pratense]
MVASTSNNQNNPPNAEGQSTQASISNASTSSTTGQPGPVSVSSTTGVTTPTTVSTTIGVINGSYGKFTLASSTMPIGFPMSLIVTNLTSGNSSVFRSPHIPPFSLFPRDSPFGMPTTMMV